MAAGPLLHTAALATRQTGGWAAQSKAALSAQGNASGSAAGGGDCEAEQAWGPGDTDAHDP